MNVDLEAAGRGGPKGACGVNGGGGCCRTDAQGGGEALGLESYERHGRLQRAQEYEAKNQKRKCPGTGGDRRDGVWGLGLRTRGRRGSVELNHCEGLSNMDFERAQIA